ncbi:MAG: YggS family pyridoxal phosphate enzyme [Candidatus Nanopelagicales bacterium]
MSRTARREQVRANLATARTRIAGACATVGRDPAEITIVAITKTFPTSDVALLAELGITQVGENRDQEARVKAQECGGLGLTWHFVGQLQRNKAGSVARYADVVQSVDRGALIGALDRGAGAAGRRLGICVQVDLSEAGADTGGGPDLGPEAGRTLHRGGARPDGVLALADLVAGAEHLDLLGVMAVAPLGADPQPAFDRLAAVHDRVLLGHPQARMRSAGMSGDLEAAVAAGATHVRLGSALLGHREPLK